MGKIKNFVHEHEKLVKGVAVLTGVVVCGVVGYYLGSTKVSITSDDVVKAVDTLDDDNLLKRLIVNDHRSSARCFFAFDKDYTIADLGKVGELALGVADCPEFVTKDTNLTGVLLMVE